MKKIVSGIMLTLLFIVMFSLAISIRSVKSEPKTWIVDDDGPADFHTIQEAINAANPGDTIYVYNGTYYESVVVNKTLSLIGEDKDSTIIDGNLTGDVVLLTADNIIVMGFTIRRGGWNSGVLIGFRSCNNTVADCIVNSNKHGIYLDTESCNNNIIDNVLVSNYPFGIFAYRSYNNNVVNNIVSLNDDGIYLYNSWNNNVKENIITNNGAGILLGTRETCANNILGNDVSGNDFGIRLHDGPQGNNIYHNNFINNTNQASVGYPSRSNVWDDGYPSGGNYWSDYTDVDLYSGPYQNETGSDGVWDDPYVIDEKNQDNYPLVKPYGSVETVFNVSWNKEIYPVTVVSNSTVTDLDFSQPLKQISFNITGPNGSAGFCNITIPKALLWSETPEDWQIKIDGTPITDFTVTENQTHTSLYFTYIHSTHQIRIIGTKVIGEEERVLLGTGWGWMRIAHREYVRGPAELYKIGDTQIELVITIQGERYSRTWSIILHREHKHHEIYFCLSPEHGPLIVVLHHARLTFWLAVGKGTIAFGFPRFGRLRPI